MSNSPPSSEAPATEMLFLGDDIALDFINTSYGVDQGARECFRNDTDVLDWLQRVALPAKVAGSSKPGELLRQALELRELALELVEKRSAGKIGNPQRLNRLLANGSRYSELRWPRGGHPELTSHERLEGVDGLLLPVAQAVADLLAEADFQHVRRCEGSECTLWFLDLTKAHSRRWCSLLSALNSART